MITYNLDGDKIIISEPGKRDIEVFPETAEVILVDIMTDRPGFKTQEAYENARSKYQGAIDFYRGKRNAFTYRS